MNVTRFTLYNQIHRRAQTTAIKTRIVFSNLTIDQQNLYKNKVNAFKLDLIRSMDIGRILIINLKGGRLQDSITYHVIFLLLIVIHRSLL